MLPGELEGLAGDFAKAAEERRHKAHIRCLRRDHSEGKLAEWIAQAEAGELRVRSGQLERWRRSLAELEEDRMKRTGTIYLLHFSEPIGDLSNPKGQAQHYLGFSQDLEARLEAHRNGTGAAIMAAVVEAGIEWAVVKTWRGTRDDERALKNRHQHSFYCPVCKAAAESREAVFATGLAQSDAQRWPSGVSRDGIRTV